MIEKFIIFLLRTLAVIDLLCIVFICFAPKRLQNNLPNSEFFALFFLAGGLFSLAELVEEKETNFKKWHFLAFFVCFLGVCLCLLCL